MGTRENRNKERMVRSRIGNRRNLEMNGADALTHILSRSMSRHTNRRSRPHALQTNSSRGLFNVNAQANSVTLPGADLSSALRRSMQVRSRREMGLRRRGAASLEEIASLPTFE